MSIIMARWKWATAPATAFRRWNVSRRRTVAEAQPQCRAWLILGAARGVRSGMLGRLAKATPIGPLPCSASLSQWRQGGLGSLGRHDRGLRRHCAAQEAGREGIAVGRRQTPSIDGKATA
jgi:hypothetical protein